jgi:hypothetical protein
MRFTSSPDGSFSVEFIDDKDKVTGRRCGSCQLCCKLLPVPVYPLNKPAGVRCKHSKVGAGCKIYANRPVACKTWSCRWLSDATTAGMPRPDRSHYVIDLEYDDVAITRNEGARPERIKVLQVWVDPAYPNAHRDPALRRYIADLNMPAICRYNSKDAIVVMPPGITDTGEWLEHRDNTQIVSPDVLQNVILAGVK